MSNGNFLQRLQPYWDWRAAGNFICGGAGTGLIVFTCVHAMDNPLALPLLALGLAFVGLGLFSVWLEIGRPWRAMNVFVHWRTSWMSREAIAGVVLFALGFGLLTGLGGLAWPTAAAAFTFLYCQARILSAARGIPAWREPLTAVLMAVTGLAEGVGLFWVVAAWQSPTPGGPALALAALLMVRFLAWEAWRVRIVVKASPVAVRLVQRMAPLARFGAAALPLTLLVVASLTAQPLLFALAGALVFASGAAFKFLLITRMSQQNGYSLPQMPVRGVPRMTAR